MGCTGYSFNSVQLLLGGLVAPCFMLTNVTQIVPNHLCSSGVRASVYFDAVMARHMPAWWEGEDIDPDSDLHHITKAIAGLCVIRDAMIQGKFIDDRPPKSPAGWQAALNDKVKALLAKYPNPVPPYLEGDERMRPQPSAGDLAYAKLCQQAIDDPESVKVK